MGNETSTVSLPSSSSLSSSEVVTNLRVAVCGAPGSGKSGLVGYVGGAGGVVEYCFKNSSEVIRASLQERQVEGSYDGFDAVVLVVDPRSPRSLSWAMAQLPLVPSLLEVLVVASFRDRRKEWGDGAKELTACVKRAKRKRPHIYIAQLSAPLGYGRRQVLGFLHIPYLRKRKEQLSRLLLATTEALEVAESEIELVSTPEALDSSWDSFVKWSNTPKRGKAIPVKAKSQRTPNNDNNNTGKERRATRPLAGFGSPMEKRVPLELKFDSPVAEGREMDLDSFLDMEEDGGWGEEMTSSSEDDARMAKMKVPGEISGGWEEDSSTEQEQEVLVRERPQRREQEKKEKNKEEKKEKKGKKDVKKDIVKEVKREVKKEIVKEVKREVKKEIVKEVKQEVKKEIAPENVEKKKGIVKEGEKEGTEDKVEGTEEAEVQEHEEGGNNNEKKPEETKDGVDFFGDEENDDQLDDFFGDEGENDDQLDDFFGDEGENDDQLDDFFGEGEGGDDFFGQDKENDVNDAVGSEEDNGDELQLEESTKEEVQVKKETKKDDSVNGEAGEIDLSAALAHIQGLSNDQQQQQRQRPRKSRKKKKKKRKKERSARKQPEPHTAKGNGESSRDAKPPRDGNYKTLE